MVNSLAARLDLYVNVPLEIDDWRATVLGNVVHRVGMGVIPASGRGCGTEHALHMDGSQLYLRAFRILRPGAFPRLCGAGASPKVMVR